MRRVLVVAASAVAGVVAASCSFRPGDGAGLGDDAASGKLDGDSDAPSTDAASVDGTTARLVARGLVARYLVAEADSGSGPTTLLDSAAAPLDLQIGYTQALAYASVSGHRALRWTAVGDTARAATPIASTKLAQRMTGAKTWTYELVVHGRDVTGTQARLMTIATNITGYGAASIVTSDINVLRVYHNDMGTSFTVALGSQRIVVHAVVDVDQAAAGDRVKLYVDGVLAPVLGGATSPTLGVGLAPGSTDSFVVGNVSSSGRSFDGDIFYAAVYDVALTGPEVVANATALGALDDVE